MKQTISTLLAVGLVALSGCATGTHIVTGTERPAIKSEQVVLYQVPPTKFEIVGIVNAQSPRGYQRDMDAAVQELKIQAAKIGANGVLLGGVNPGGESVGAGFGSGFGSHGAFSGSAIGVSVNGIQLSGEAIYVTP